MARSACTAFRAETQRKQRAQKSRIAGIRRRSHRWGHVGQRNLIGISSFPHPSIRHPRLRGNDEGAVGCGGAPAQAGAVAFGGSVASPRHRSGLRRSTEGFTPRHQGAKRAVLIEKQRPDR